MIYVGAYGGFRIGELCALRVDDVDWDRGTIRVDDEMITRFEESPTGRHRYLMVDALGIARVREALELLASQPPCTTNAK